MSATYPVKTCLWFDTEAEPAARLYTSLVPGSEILSISHYGSENQYGETGSVLEVDFRLGTQQFVALNGGPHFTHSPAASIQVYCPDQPELDRIWDGLLADGGQESQCGWLADRFGLSWQIIPTRLGGLASVLGSLFLVMLVLGTRLGELAGDPDPGRSSRTIAAMLKMSKLDIAALEAAADAEPTAESTAEPTDA